MPVTGRITVAWIQSTTGTATLTTMAWSASVDPAVREDEQPADGSARWHGQTPSCLPGGGVAVQCGVRLDQRVGQVVLGVVGGGEVICTGHSGAVRRDQRVRPRPGVGGDRRVPPSRAGAYGAHRAHQLGPRGRLPGGRHVLVHCGRSRGRDGRFGHRSRGRSAPHLPRRDQRQAVVRRLPLPLRTTADQGRPGDPGLQPSGTAPVRLTPTPSSAPSHPGRTSSRSRSKPANNRSATTPDGYGVPPARSAHFQRKSGYHALDSHSFSESAASAQRRWERGS